ncbi:secretory phospholipase A2 receptor-like [Mercenaria mercenaria]|uniref:secretory phospholipase A2 receptor-like n=1 Tax=Mercenaria mercenaria TaxID=6596 RepID=UPI00234F9F6A|nr:secretory phospholipase A2 receptor-like [Mercenaria mercenaria]
MKCVNTVIFMSFLLQSTDYARAATGPRCFECTRIPFARDCDHVRVCGEHEVCFTKQIVSDSGHVLYDTGCVDKQNCKSKRSLDAVQDDETGDLITCLHCCHGEFCNSQGCGSQALPTTNRGPVCFSCPKGSASPEKCDKVTACGRDQRCFIHPLNGIGGDLLYKAGCTNSCSFHDQSIVNTIVGKRDLTSCLGCCETDFCNSNCSALNHSVIVTPTKVTGMENSTRKSTKHTTTTTRYSSTSDKSISTIPPSTSKPIDRSALCKHLHNGYTYLKEYDHCVKIYNDLKLTWEQSRDQCISDGGNLMIFHNKQEEGYFETLTEQPTNEWDSKRYWVGASDLSREGQWLWSDNTPVNKIYFYPNEPNNGGPHSGTENCGATAFINRTFLLNDDDCSHQYHFICEIDTGAATNKTNTLDVSQCRNSHYTLNALQGTCFNVYDVMKLSMEAARKACQNEGADLLQLKDRNAEQFFLDFGFKDKENNSRRYWLGARRHHGGDFYWLDGRKFDNSYIWAPGEPNFYKNSEECVDLTWFAANEELHAPDAFALNDDNCGTSYFFICEETRGH